MADFSEVPMLDVSALAGEDAAARGRVSEELGRTLETVGFVYLTGHGVSSEVIDTLRDAARRFFDLPEAEKAKLAIDRNFRGYLPMASSTIVTSSVAKVTRPNQSESLMLMHEVAPDHPDALAGKPLQGPNQWPDEALVPGFRAAAETYVQALGALGRRMVRAIAVALGLPPDHLDPHFEHPTTFLRLLHYPPQKVEEGLFGSAPHTDYGFITLLNQDQVGGLEVQNGAGDWIAAPPVRDSFVMNVGDILARWSNGRFVSTPHRVINHSGRERYSQPFFFDPSMDSTIAALPGTVTDAAPARYAPVLFRDYLMERIDKNYHYRKADAARG